MARVLFYQNGQLGAPSCVFVDGRSVDSDKATEQLQLLFSYVNRLGKKPEPWVARLDGHYVVKGFLDRTDEIGRRMTFVYILPATIYSERDLLALLTQDLSVGGAALGSETIQAIQNYESSKRVQFNFAIVAIIIVLLIIVYILIKT